MLPFCHPINKLGYLAEARKASEAKRCILIVINRQKIMGFRSLVTSPCRSPKYHPATKRESSRFDLCSRSVIGAGLRGSTGDRGCKLTVVDRFRLNRRNPSR